MFELKRSLNDLKKKIYDFQDVSENADNTFIVSDFPDKFLLGKNYFKMHLKEDILVLNSQVYIDIIDSFGNSLYYKVISDNLPNKERIVAVYVYDTTPVGDCEVVISGRILKNPNTDQIIPYSNDPSSPIYHGNPNVVWRRVIQINPQEVENKIYFSVPPTVTYYEIRKPQYQVSNENRLVVEYPTTSSATATMYSNRGLLVTVNSVDRKPGDTKGHIINTGTSSVTFVPITPINNEDEISSLYFTDFHLTSSMEGGRVYFNNIPYQYPKDAAVTQSNVLTYSGSIAKVVSSNLCYVVPPFYKILQYVDVFGNSKNLVIDGFRGATNFTTSYYGSPSIIQSTSSYDSYIKLEIQNAEPDIGSVKSVNVKAKRINKPGSFVDLGTYDVVRKNMLIVDSGSYKIGKYSIEPINLGNLRGLITASNYWTGSSNNGVDFDFYPDDSISDGMMFPDRTVIESSNYFVEMSLRQPYFPTIRKGVEYELSFDMLYPQIGALFVPRQLDVYISGSIIEGTGGPFDSNLPPIKDSRLGTYIGSISGEKTLIHHPRLYFTAKETGRITPKFVHRSTGVVYNNIELVARNEPGFSPNFIDLEVPLPKDFNSRSEISVEVEYYNSRDDRANYNTILYGVIFDGNTPQTGSSTTLPSGLVSGSDQLTSSYDIRYERLGTGIISGSNQISQLGYITSASINQFTSSIQNQVNSILLTTGSLNTFTASIQNQVNSIKLTTGSLNTFTSSVQLRLSSLETSTSSYATTSSNSFSGNQIITGSVIATSFTGSFTGSFHGIPSSSLQIKALLPSGVASGSEQFTGSYDTRYEIRGGNIVSSSIQINYDQVTNKPNIKTPGQYRVLTSDGTVSGSQANQDITFISSSSVIRLRQSNMSEREQSVSSSFWSTDITYITQSIFNVTSGGTNMFLNFPVFKDNETYAPVTSSVYNVSYLVKIETNIYGLTGSLSSPKDSYNWGNTVEFRAFNNPAFNNVISGVTIQTSSKNNSGSLGGFGTTYSGVSDINSWVNIAGITNIGSGNIQFRLQMTSTGSGTWNMYVSSVCRVVKTEIRI